MTSVERSLRTKYLCVAGFCGSICLGLLSGIGGLVIGFVSWLGLVGQGLRIGGTLMMMAAFPLFIVAAHCMDRVDAVNKEVTSITENSGR